MKKTIKLALVAAMAMGATSAFATNGDHLIGLGTKSRSMGGTGIAHFNGAESALANPALITKAKGTEFSFGGTYFHPSVNFSNDQAGAGSSRSEASHNMIPEVALVDSLGDGWAIGVGMFGTAGMGTDYRNAAPAAGTMNIVTNLQLMKFAVPIAYEINGLSIGFAPVLQYGALDINYDDGGAFGIGEVGSGVSQDYGLGYELGLAYELKDMGITLGAKYSSEISMTYEDQISGAAAGFDGTGFTDLGFDDELAQPASYGLGIDWTEGDISATFDYKKIKWGSAEGYKDFNWEDQNVYALGLEYRMDALALRAGYNYASNCVKEANGATPDGAAINFLNLGGFPAITESHWTIGAGYQFTKHVSADLGFVYAPEVTETYDVSGLTMTTVTTNHKQYGVSGAINFNF